MKIKVKMVEWFDDHWYKVEFLNEKGVLETRWIPSVTTKLGIVDKPFLGRWRGDIGNREADMRIFEAQERGSRIHNAWHILCKGGKVLFNPPKRPNFAENEVAILRDELLGNLDVVKYQDEYVDLLKLVEFMKATKAKVRETEKIVYSLDDNDAGTVDNLLEFKEGQYKVNGSRPLHIPGGVYVVDLKTGKSVDRNAYLQTASYHRCVKKMGLADPVGTMILHTQSMNRAGIEGLGVSLRVGADVENDLSEYDLASRLWEIRNKEKTPKVFEFPSMIQLGG